MNIAIVDDLKEDRCLIRKKIEDYMNEINLEFKIYEFKSGEEFLKNFTHDSFTLVFLDIYMDKLTGMDVAWKIYSKDKNCKIIFLTTTEDFSRQSYSVKAVYYLVKPIQHKEFYQAMDFCELKKQYETPKLAVISKGLDLRLNTDKILYIDIRNRVTTIHLIEQTIPVNGTFSEITKSLAEDKRFLITVRGVMVNMQHIIKHSDSIFILNNGETVPINLRNKKEIGQCYRNYVFENMGGL